MILLMVREALGTVLHVVVCKKWKLYDNASDMRHKFMTATVSDIKTHGEKDACSE